ncbi:MAG: FAD-dependent oxidoreductase [Planctomycetes bacterium]|nr:FAD-dependent oxidoreductase [Planctomycetota bacterium]
MRKRLVSSCCILLISTFSMASAAEYDIVIYGGTAAGAAAAVQGAKMGKTVLLIEPGKHIGGLTSGGLGATDIGNKAAIGGLSREFYQRVKTYYQNEAVWHQETRAEHFKNSRRNRGTEKAMWTFEPHVAEKILRNMLAENKVQILFQERLDLKNGVTKKESRIVSIRLESGKEIQGKMFIDATYEGDLMATAGVSYHVGREANTTYGETLNGVQKKMNVKNHRFLKPVDPYVTPGDPSSGLLPGVHGAAPGEEGEGDRRVQAYCFRMCMTDAPGNRLSWIKPADYDPLRYEILLRNFEAGDHRAPWSPTLMPNRKTDTNNNGAFSTDNIGKNYDYPEADYQTRERIFREHLSYQQGLMWTLANHPRVPQKVREVFQQWSLAKDEFTGSGHWPHQLYIREARRLISDYVMTQHNCQGRREVEDSVAMAAYTMDSHNVQRYVDNNGNVRNEGDVQVGGFAPFPISYRSIVPKKSQCTNLFVPVCLSASHIAYGSIRMEPVFMVLGQSAATAASHAIDEDVAVQNVDSQKLKTRLLADKQVLKWTGPRPAPPIDITKLPGKVWDNREAKLSGDWVTSRSVGGYVAGGYLHDSNRGKGTSHVVFTITVKKTGRYEVRISYTPNPNRATNVPVTVSGTEPARTVRVNQKLRPKYKGFHSLGLFRFESQHPGSVTISNEGTNGYVIVDAVQVIPRQ